MNHYYDEWGHAYRIVVNRLVTFFGFSIGLSLCAWYALMRQLFGWTLIAVATSVWPMVHGDVELVWRLVFWLLVATCSLIVLVVFVVLTRSGLLRRGDAHRRGTRVIDPNDKNP